MPRYNKTSGIVYYTKPEHNELIDSFIRLIESIINVEPNSDEMEEFKRNWETKNKPRLLQKKEVLE